MSQQPHLSNLTFKVCEILEGGECCTDLGQWPQTKVDEKFNFYSADAHKDHTLLTDDGE
jgi:hypothetical protein